jgi:hypothetical protein
MSWIRQYRNEWCLVIASLGPLFAWLRPIVNDKGVIIQDLEFYRMLKSGMRPRFVRESKNSGDEKNRWMQGPDKSELRN